MKRLNAAELDQLREMMLLDSPAAYVSIQAFKTTADRVTTALEKINGPDAVPLAIEASQQAIELLRSLVAALDGTTWSSWQTTANFASQQQAAADWLEAIGRI